MTAIALNCTQCAAPLPHLGGRQVESITCQYCNASHDTKTDDKLRFIGKLEQHSDAVALVPLGSECTFKGIPFVVIGMLEYNAEGDIWQEYSIYSETHGYAWLSHNNGHFTFSHRVRNVTLDGQFALHNETYYPHADDYRATLTYVAGELTWEAKLGDKTNVDEFHAGNLAISIESSNNETEFFLEEYIPNAKVREAFDWEHAPTIYGAHPLEKWAPSPLLASVMSVSHWGMLFALIMYFFSPGMSSSPFLSGSIQQNQVISSTFNSSTSTKKNEPHLVKIDPAKVGTKLQFTFNGKLVDTLNNVHIVLGPMDQVSQLTSPSGSLNLTKDMIYINNLLLGNGYRSSRHSRQVKVTTNITLAKKVPYGVWIKTKPLAKQVIYSSRFTVSKHHKPSYFIWLFIICLIPTLWSWFMRIGLFMQRASSPQEPPTMTTKGWGHD